MINMAALQCKANLLPLVSAVKQYRCRFCFFGWQCLKLAQDKCPVPALAFAHMGLQTSVHVDCTRIRISCCAALDRHLTHRRACWDMQLAKGMMQKLQSGKRI